MEWLIAALALPVVIFFGGVLLHLYRTSGPALCLGLIVALTVIVFAAIF